MEAGGRLKDFSKNKLAVAPNLKQFVSTYLSKNEFFLTRDIDNNPHARAALLRRMVTREVGKLCRDAGVYRVVDMYGAKRTVNLIPDLRVTVHSPNIVAHDLGSPEVVPNISADGLVYFDVYDVEPEEVAYHLQKSGARKAFITVLSIGSGGANMFGAAWRDGEHVHYLTESGDCLYTNRYPDWLYKGTRTLNVFRKRVLGPYDVFEVTLDAPLTKACVDLPQLDQVKEENVSFTWDMIWTVGLIWSMYYYIKTRLGSPTMSWVFWAPAVVFCTTEMNFSTRTRFSQNNCHAIVRQTLRHDPNFDIYVRLMARANLDLATRIQYGTLSKVWYMTRKRFRDHLKSTALMGAEHDREIEVYLESQKLSWMRFILDMIVILLCLTCIAVVVWKRYLPLWIYPIPAGLLVLIRLYYIYYKPKKVPFGLYEKAVETGDVEEWFRYITDVECVPLPYDYKVQAVEYDGPDKMPEIAKGCELTQAVLPPKGHIYQYVYPIFQAMANLPRPASGERNSYVMLRHRILCDPPYVTGEGMSGVLKLFFCDMLVHYRFMMERFSVSIEDMEDVISDMPTGKRAFARTNLEYIKDGSFRYSGKLKMKFMSKHNETIGWKKIDNQVCLVSRAIANVDAIPNLALQYSARMAGKRFFAMGFDEDSNSLRIHRFGEFSFSYYYVKSFSSKQLSNVFNQAAVSSTDVCFMILGDDSLAIRRVKGKLVAFECDFSKYDMTQGDEMQKFVRWFLKCLQLPKGCIALWERLIYEKSFTIPLKNGKWRGKRNPQQLTGIATTSVCNSILNLAASVYAHYLTDDVEKLSEAYSRCGLKAKLWLTPIDLGPVFLRGWFVRERYAWNSWTWAPLPSQIYKLGKMIEKPTVVAKTRDLASAYRKCAYALAMSYADLDDDYPILGAFITRLLKESERSEVDPSFIEDRRYKVNLDGTPCSSRKHVIECIKARYDVTEKEIVETENLIKRAPFPGVFGNRCLWVMLSDYGGSEWASIT